MLRRRSSPPSVASAKVEESMAEAASAAARGDWFYHGVRDACTAEQRREAERRASLPLGVEEAAP